MAAPGDMTQDAVGADLVSWATAHGAPADRHLIRRLARVVTAIAPELSPSRATLLARYGLWTFLVDDALDDMTADPRALTDLAGRLTTLVRTTTAATTAAGTAAGTGPHPLDTMLAELLAEPPVTEAPALLARFADALCTAIDTGVQHTIRAQRMRQGRAGAPTVVEYLSVAGHHVNYASFAYLLLILTGARPAAASPRVGTALMAASRAIRIANDVASVDRDRAAGRLNIVLLRQPADAAGIAAFGRRIDRYVQLHDRLLRDVADTGVLSRSLHVAVAVYRTADLR